MVHSATVQAAFERAAATYDAVSDVQKQMCAHLITGAYAHVGSHLATPPSMIMDMGAGTGRLTALLRGAFPMSHLIALDFSAAMLNTIPTGTANLKLCAPAERAPLAPRSVNVIFTSAMVQWFSDPSIFLNHAHRLLSANGALCIATFGPDTLAEWRTAWRAVWRDAKGRDGHEGAEPSRTNAFLSATAWRAALERAGFKVVAEASHTATTQHASVRQFVQCLRDMGSSAALLPQSAGLIGKHRWRTMCAAYPKLNNTYPATWHSLYFFATKHHHGA